MEPGLLMGLGRGLEALGQYRIQDRLARQEQERLDKIRRDEQERQDRATKNLLAQFAFQQGLEPLEAAQARGEAAAQPLDMAGTALESLAGMPGLGTMSGGAPMLRRSAEQARRNATRGRRLTITDPSTGQPTEYIQPYERSEEGRREAQRTRTLERLKAAGFDDATADLLADAGPDEIASALLERLKPKTPRRQFDSVSGRVIDLDTMTSDVVPGIEPRPRDTGTDVQNYNNTVVTDEATGQRYLVNPRTGETVGTVTRPDGTPIRDVPQTVREQVAGIDDVLSNLNILETLVTQYGIETMPGRAKADLASAYAATQLGYKEAARLGAITGPDMQIILNAIPDPTSITAGVRGGKESVLAGIRRVRQQMQNRRKTMEQQYGVPSGNDTYSGLR